ncbi:MAG: peptide deformylase [Pseudomonadota bacterium]
MIREILSYPDPILRELSQPLLSVGPDTAELARDMLETMYAAAGRGLAAPQIGVLQRVFVMDETWKTAAADPQVFINPEILDRARTVQTNSEACLSIPDREVEVARPDWITLLWLTPDGALKRGKFNGIAAAIVCHEIDHLDGRLILDLETTF